MILGHHRTEEVYQHNDIREKMLVQCYYLELFHSTSLAGEKDTVGHIARHPVWLWVMNCVVGPAYASRKILKVLASHTYYGLHHWSIHCNVRRQSALFVT